MRLKQCLVLPSFKAYPKKHFPGTGERVRGTRTPYRGERLGTGSG